MPLFATQPSRLVAADGRELTLQQVHLDAEASAGLARTRVRQTFTNRFAEPLEVTYQLPLPADGAVVDFAFVLDDRRVRGRVGRSHEARAAYEQARVEGRTAALLEQARSSVFTQQIGHLPPGAQLTAEIVVEHPLAWRDGSWEYRFPTVVAPRFHREDAHDEPPVEVEVLDGMPPARCALGLVIGDPLTAPVASPSHEIIASEGGVVLAECLGAARVTRLAAQYGRRSGWKSFQH